MSERRQLINLAYRLLGSLGVWWDALGDYLTALGFGTGGGATTDIPRSFC